MNNRYLIPANSKKALMFFGMFYTFDLILFGIGVGISLLLIMFLPISQFIWAVIAVLPGLVTGFLVFPIPNYHNVLTVIISMFTFLTQSETFKWKGWCFLDEYKDNKKG